MLGIMYHYFRDNDVKSPNFKNLTIDKFIDQLEYFDKKYGFVNQDVFLESIENNTAIKEGVVLTFDDGFKDHYDNVFSILHERGLWGFFYIPTGHYTNGKVMNVHRIHYLLGKYDVNHLLQIVTKDIDSSMIEESRLKEFTSVYSDQNLSQKEFQFKRLLNYYLKNEYKFSVLDSLMEDLSDESEVYRSLYLQKDEMKEMEANGMIIGSHTKTHPVLSSLSYQGQKDEIKSSYDFLQSFLSMKCKSFCYPYGGDFTYNKDTYRILEEEGVHHSFAVGNKPLDSFKNKFELFRMDCNRYLEI